MYKSKVILTGSTGLVGSMIKNTLGDKVELIQITRDKSFQNPFDQRFYFLDLINKSEVDILIKSTRPDFLIHCAAKIPSSLNPDNSELAAYNSKIDENIISAVSKIPCQLIYMSTTSVYGNPVNTLNIDESFPLNSSSFYSAQKIAAEKRIADNLENGLILRINAPYGINMRIETVMNLFIQRAILNQTIFLYGSGSRMQDFTNTRDIAVLISNLINSQKLYSGIYNISYGQPISMLELANKIVRICNSDSLISFAGIEDDQENCKASYSINKAKSILNWEPKISLENGLKELVSSKQIK